MNLPAPPAVYSQKDQIETRRTIALALSGNQPIDPNSYTTPTQLTADQNDYTVRDVAILRLSSDASRNITGIVARTDALTLINVGTQNIVLQNQNAGSSATNRIITGAGADITVAPDDVAHLWYDETTGRWRVIDHY